MFRLSAEYHRHKRSADKVARARQDYERAQAFNKRWRRKSPTRDPSPLLTQWTNNKTARSQEYTALMIQFMSSFDGVSDANAMMRHGLEAGDAQIDLAQFHDMAGKVFSLRMFEVFAENVNLSPYTRELILQRMVPALFAPAGRTRPGFEAAIVPLAQDPVQESSNKPRRR